MLYTINDMAEVLGLSNKDIYYYFYSGQCPECFVAVKKNKKNKIYVNEKFIEFYRKKKTPVDYINKIVDKIYFLVDKIDKKFSCDEDYSKIYSILVKKILENDCEDKYFTNMGSVKIRSMIKEFTFKTYKRAERLDNVLDKIIKNL